MNKVFTITMVTLLFALTLGIASANPNGASTVTPGTSSRFSSGQVPETHEAFAGNVTELTIYGESITQTWQGYYGNVTGAIRLANSDGDDMYNWSLASPRGEIFASVDDSVSWTGVQCFNWSENGTTLEATYNIGNAADGVNETFSDSNTHSGFSVGSTTFAASDCMATNIYGPTGPTIGVFEQVLLADAAGNPIFTALLEQDVLGFDNRTYDFQMLVLEDGHNGDTATTPYYFYVELE